MPDEAGPAISSRAPRRSAGPVDLASRTSSLEARSGLGANRGLDVRRVARRDPGSGPACSARRSGRGMEAPRRASTDRRRCSQAGPRSGRRSVRTPLWCRAFGPRLFFREAIPKTHLTFIEPGSQLPGGLLALYDGRGRNETPLWLPEQRTLVFADALTAPMGELRVWASPAHQERALPALRALLELPFERVIASHGEPVHSRAAYERALELPTW